MDHYPISLSLSDPVIQKKVDALLAKEGIRRDPNLQYTCGIFDEDGQLVATGSYYGSTLRCLAVDSSLQGQGLMGAIVFHLLSVLADQGITQVFLYTKPKNRTIFSDLGFYEIAHTEDVLFMENRRGGLDRFIGSLQTESAGFLDGHTAIVMNANPFTNGHRYLIEQAALRSNVHVFILEEENDLIAYSVRKRLVEEGIEDLSSVCVHRTGPYMISHATFPSYFLKDEDQAITNQAKLDLAVFGKIAKALGITARYVGEEPFSQVTKRYNEVMKAYLPSIGIGFCKIPRLAMAKDESDGQASLDHYYVSASRVRQLIHEGRIEEIRPLVPESTYQFFISPEASSTIQKIQKAKNVIHY